jgi:hypothetical protein
LQADRRRTVAPRRGEQLRLAGGVAGACIYRRFDAD